MFRKESDFFVTNGTEFGFRSLKSQNPMPMKKGKFRSIASQ